MIHNGICSLLYVLFLILDVFVTCSLATRCSGNSCYVLAITLLLNAVQQQRMRQRVMGFEDKSQVTSTYLLQIWF
jgi:hypothetical protein